jgi:hypothetical protein
MTDAHGGRDAGGNAVDSALDSVGSPFGLFAAVGIVAPLLTQIATTMPRVFITALGGLAMLPVLINAFGAGAAPGNPKASCGARIRAQSVGPLPATQGREREADLTRDIVYRKAGIHLQHAKNFQARVIYSQFSPALEQIIKYNLI